MERRIEKFFLESELTYESQQSCNIST